MGHYIGIDLGGTRIKLGLVEEERIVARRDFMAQSALGIARCLPRLEEAVDSMMRERGVAKIDGVGLSFPGLVDVDSCRVVSTYGKYDDAKEVDLRQWTQRKWGAPLFMDNDTRMATVGEWRYGAAKECDDVVMMTLGTGIGTSAILQGRIVRGKHFQAGCMGGHFIVDLHGLACSCGGRGCVEAHSASWSIDRQARADALFGQSLLAECPAIGYKELFDAARRGDALACRIRDTSLHVWSAGIVSLIHAFDPEVVVLGGAVMNSRDEVLPSVRAFVDRYACTPWGRVRVEASALMDDAAILGVNYCLQTRS